MNAVAIIVGINAYPDQPLTSAVSDALAFRNALIDLGLANQDSITLLTAPAAADSKLATRDAITAALREPYLHGDDIDRMYVFFSGHGMLVQSNASHSASATAFLPADVRDPMSEPWKLLNLDDLLRSFRTAGPREQFFFIDACRNLRYDQYPPELGPIGLAGRTQPPVGGRAQSVLYAVSPGGQALGNLGGLGVMTSHLVQALHGTGEALDFDDERDSYVITAQSLYAYVAARIKEQIAGLAQWQQEYMLPDQQYNGPPLRPLRLVTDPGPGRLTLTVDPPGDAEYVNVTVLQRGARLEEPRWPPSPFGTPVEIPRQRIRLSAGSHYGATGVDPELVDGRTMTTALIRHKYYGPLGPGPKLPAEPVPTPPEPNPGPADVTYSESSPVTTRGTYNYNAFSRPASWLEAVVAEPWATVEINGLDPPYLSETAQARSDDPAQVAMPPGSYRVRFRVGSEQFSETIAELEDGRVTTVRATAFASPLVASVTGQTEHQAAIELSEHFGPVQANPALALATLIALGRAHDSQAMFQFAEPIPSLPAPNPDSWLSLAVAVDGSAWERPAAQVAAELQAEVTTPRAYHPNPIQLTPMGRSAGLNQIVGGAALAPLPNCTLAVRSAQIGEIELPVAASRRMVTAIGIVVRADGGLDVAQVLTPLHLDEVTVAEHARRLLLGQWLHQGGELISYAQASPRSQLGGILTGDAVDPVLSPMAYHALSRILAAGESDQLSAIREDRERIGRRLVGQYPEHVDSAVIANDLGLDRGQGLGLAWTMLSYGQLPLLADSLALASANLGQLPAQASELAKTIRPGSLWTLRWKQPRQRGT
ncbi:MAG TPA: caspase family protein [Streptosporangiaceae bacterium]|nr:caspase family protein [Streptosporangiaceae bacterium]